MAVFSGKAVIKLGFGALLAIGFRAIIRGDLGGTAGGVGLVLGLFTPCATGGRSGTSEVFSSNVDIKAAKPSGSAVEDARFMDLDLPLSPSSMAEGSNFFSTESAFFPNVSGWRIVGSCTGFKNVLSKKFRPHDAPGALLDLSWTGNLPGIVAAICFSRKVRK